MRLIDLIINIPQLLFLKVLLFWFHDVSASQGVMYLDLITGMLKFKFKGIGYTVLRRRLKNSTAMCCGEHVCVIYVSPGASLGYLPSAPKVEYNSSIDGPPF